MADQLVIPDALLAFDPGINTGYAYFLAGKLISAATIGRQDIAWQYRSIRDVLGGPSLGTKVVVCEGYTSPKGWDRYSIETVKLIGWIHGLALCNGLPFVQQMPPAKKPFLELAKALPHDSPHAVDAIAHGLAYLAKCRKG